MTATVESATTPATDSTLGPIPASERLPLLDILRGFAILVMIIVHFTAPHRGTTGGGAIGATIQQAIQPWFLLNKGWATFAILFGVSFAIQLHRADARGEDVRWRFLRRLLGILGFGGLVVALCGAGVLIFYALSGVWLLIIRRWSTRALLVAVLASATLGSVWNVAVGSYQWATMGVEGANTVYQSPRPAPGEQAAVQELRATEQGTSFLRLAAARVVRYLYWALYADLWGDWRRGAPGVLLGSLSRRDLTLFLIGLLALRLGLFARPANHRRLIVAAMLVGTALWAVDQWGLHESLWAWLPVIPVVRVAQPIYNGFIFGDDEAGWYLALTYIGAINLLVGFSKAWEQWLTTIFGAAGRLALTNYIVQCAMLRVVFDNFGFGVTGLTPQLAVASAVILFATLAVFSRWWLERFRLGPTEWLLRSLTYARLQPLRRPLLDS